MREMQEKEQGVALAFELGPMRRRDLKQVLAIERAVFPEPWSVGIFTSELALRKSRAYTVARSGRRVAGYVGLMFVDDEAHVTTIAVAPEHQRQGLGTLLMIDVVRTSTEAGACHLSLEVATGNHTAQALYRRFGFAPAGVRKGYYPATGEDAIVMFARDISSHPYVERVRRIEAELRSRR